ncbi:MAG: TatD family hydrolase [Mariniphaga sp.]|nr:TatD family hydrolase [Mariniphaga sp.]MDD4226386.1 TatD family hydrolase [Mariniphaga sp.]MDD4425329.1 TatD family hydrolase [Mariniphaga sp.]
MLIDTHAHIYSEEFLHDVDEVLQRAYDNDVKKIILPNIDSGTVKRLLDLNDAYPHLCFPLMGLHPTSVSADFREELEAVEYWLGKRSFYGVGEIGIDLYWDRTFLKEQQDAFRYQIKLAKLHNLPIVIHVRDSFEEVYTIVQEEQDGTLQGVFHCFSGDKSEAQKVIDLGFLLGIGGVVTFKNNQLAEVVKSVPLRHVVLETDAPYLSPVPKRGNRNESAYIIYVAQEVAKIYDISVREVAEITSENARRLFRI